MVRGLDLFKKYFKAFSNNYVIIGGTARDIIIEEAGFESRGTKDIDMILVVEALDALFVKKFWEFINSGEYELKEKNSDDRRYYRFYKPKNEAYPFMLELFSRNPNLFDRDTESHLTPIPVEEGLTSLSAILLDDDYYQFIIEHSTVEYDLHLANTEALICLKAKAYLDLSRLKAEGYNVDSKDIRKHHSDIYRLAITLNEGVTFDLPQTLSSDLLKYCNTTKDKLPNNIVFKNMGIVGINPQDVRNQILNSFQLGKMEI